MSENNNLNEVIKDIKEQQKIVNKAIEDSIDASEEVKEGLVDKEEAKNVGVLLYNAILETVVDILNQPEVKTQYDIIKEKLDDKTMAALTSIIGVAASHAAYRAIIFHDNLLKEELIKQFDNLVMHINEDKKRIGLLETRMLVSEKRVEGIRTKLITDKISEEVN